MVKNRKYYAVFSCEIETKPKIDKWTIPLDKHVGIDVNTSEDNFCVLNNGTKKDNPHFYQETEKQMSKLAKKISYKKHKRNKEDKTKPSKRYLKSKLHFAKQAERVCDKRKDFIFQEVSKLLKSYDFFGVEKLKVEKMIRDNSEKGKWYFNKRMLDSSLSMFLNILAFKVEETGKWVVKVNPCNTSQKCSNCQKLAPKKLELVDRTFICAYCDNILDRDINSAKNILYKAQITEFGTNFVRQDHAG